MLARTFRNRFCLLLCNAALLYMGLAYAILGLLPVVRDQDKSRVRTSPYMTAYCMFAGCLVTGLFGWNVYCLVFDPEINVWYGGVGRITWTLLYCCSLVLISSFYAIAILKRRQVMDYYNTAQERTQSYGSFYRGRSSVERLRLEDVDSVQELKVVYLRFFYKAFLVHFLVLILAYEIARRGCVISGVHTLLSFGFVAFPYVIKSLTSSLLYLNGARTSFLYQKMDLRLRRLREELRALTRSKRSAFEKMSRFCEMSDYIDQLAGCYDHINDTVKTLIGLFRFEMVLVLLYSVINTLHGMFSQYQVVAMSLKRGNYIDQPLFAANVLYILLNIVEILMVVNVSDAIHRGSLRVGKTMQSLMYFEGLDIRLRRSIESFSLQVCQDRVQIKLLGMHLLNFPLVLGILDATVTYLVIMIQFYHQ